MAGLNQNDTIAQGNPTGVVTINPGDTIGNNVQYYNSGGTTYQNSQYAAADSPTLPTTPPTTAPSATPAPTAPVSGSPTTPSQTPGQTPAPYTGDPEMAPAFLNSNPQSLTQQGLANAQASGQSAPQDAGAAKTAIKDFTPPTSPDTSNITNALAQDPGYQKILTDAKTASDVATQGTSMLQEYQKLEADAGLPAIDSQLLNTQAIINGTEDDIRNEVTAAGGFATDSQVLALSAARNKSLIQNYNNLLATKTNAENHINTMVNLFGQDKQNAIQAANQQLNIDSQLADYQQKFLSNASEGYNNVIKAVGYSGLVNSLLNSDPSGGSVTMAEQVLGLKPGQLQQIGSQEQAANNLTELKPYNVATPYAVTANGEVWNTQTGYAYTSAQDFQQKTGMSLDQANAKKSITSIAQLQSQAQQQANQMAQLDIQQKEASINSSNASAGSSAASTAKSNYELGFEQNNAGMTPSEVNKQQTDTETATQKINSDAASYIEKLAGNKINWNDAWNAMKATYPDLSTQAIDNLLQSQNYRR